MNASDWNEMSDKTFSQISRIGNSRLLQRSTLDHFSNAQSGHAKCTSGLTKSSSVTMQTERLMKILASCNESITDYVKSRFIFHCAKQVRLNNGNALSDAVTKKLKELIMIHEVSKYTYLPPPVKDTHEELTILGITDLPKYKFSYAEKMDIKCYVETMFREKIHEFLLRFESGEKTKKDAMKMNEAKARQKLFEYGDLQFIEWKERIEDLSTKFEKDILQCRHLLNAWRELKYSDASELYYRKAGYLLLQGQVAEVQAKITKLSCLFRMFKETSVTIDAFKILNASVDEKLSVVLMETKRKENLKKSYERLEGTEYDKVLQSYLDLCKVIKRKRHILDRL